MRLLLPCPKNRFERISRLTIDSLIITYLLAIARMIQLDEMPN